MAQPKPLIKLIDILNLRHAWSPVAGVALGLASTYYYYGVFDGVLATLTLIVVMLISFGSFFINDYADYVSGVDTLVSHEDATKWTGGGKPTVMGLISPSTLLVMSIVSFTIAGVLGLYLVFLTGLWPLLAIGLIAAFTGAFYVAPPLKLSYRVYGVPEFLMPFNFTFLIVLATSYIQLGSFAMEPLVACIPALIAPLAPRLLGEIPDYYADKQAGKLTLAGYLGREKAARVALYPVIVSATILVLEVWLGLLPYTCLVGLVFFPIAVWKVYEARYRYEEGRRLVPCIKASFLHLFGVKALLALGFLITILLN
ncbi:MAG: hypothetical protein DRJ98_00280 [Thermoprotei archaeon]|nr:MAG: hypothetical protein DRJ98_00280 [Thermoprotei archaeon]RLF18822.1 MAG: hypothetical protein DRN06_00375 [Thermoprotei archaeon]